MAATHKLAVRLTALDPNGVSQPILATVTVPIIADSETDPPAITARFDSPDQESITKTITTARRYRADAVRPDTQPIIAMHNLPEEASIINISQSPAVKLPGSDILELRATIRLCIKRSERLTRNPVRARAAITICAAGNPGDVDAFPITIMNTYGITIQPPSLEFAASRPSGTKKLLLTSNDNKPFEITSYRAAHCAVNTSVSPSSAANRHWLEVSPPHPTHSAPSDTITVFTTHPEAKEVQIPVALSNAEDLVSP